jgi:predicted HicB family RNase H-like nuclease
MKEATEKRVEATLRIPAGLYAQVVALAKEDKRSLNAYLIKRLDEHVREQNHSARK